MGTLPHELASALADACERAVNEAKSSIGLAAGAALQARHCAEQPDREWRNTIWAAANYARDALMTSNQDSVRWFVANGLKLKPNKHYDWRHLEEAVWIVMNREQKWLAITLDK